MNLYVSLLSIAADNGQLNCLKYAHKSDCPLNKSTCYIAAENGHLNCLKYAHENGCPWDESICDISCEDGHHKILKYSVENGCKYNVINMFFNIKVTNKKIKKCIEYIKEF